MLLLFTHVQNCNSQEFRKSEIRITPPFVELEKNGRLAKKLYFSTFRLGTNSLFVFNIFLTIFLAARKFKKVNPTKSISLCHVLICLSFIFIATTVLSYIYTYIIIEYFKEMQNKIKKATIAALTPGLVLLPTAIGKYSS